MSAAATLCIRTTTRRCCRRGSSRPCLATTAFNLLPSCTLVHRSQPCLPLCTPVAKRQTISNTQAARQRLDTRCCTTPAGAVRLCEAPPPAPGTSGMVSDASASVFLSRLAGANPTQPPASLVAGHPCSCPTSQQTTTTPTMLAGQHDLVPLPSARGANKTHTPFLHGVRHPRLHALHFHPQTRSAQRKA